jgi:hypothetical protein
VGLEEALDHAVDATPGFDGIVQSQCSDTDRARERTGRELEN